MLDERIINTQLSLMFWKGELKKDSKDIVARYALARLRAYLKKLLYKEHLVQ